MSEVRTKQNKIKARIESKKDDKKKDKEVSTMIANQNTTNKKQYGGTIPIIHTHWGCTHISHAFTHIVHNHRLFT